MALGFNTISNFGSPYGGMLVGNTITAQLNGQTYGKNESKETLAAKIGDIELKFNPKSTKKGLGLDVFDKYGNLKSNIVFDSEGKVLYLGTDTSKGTGAYYWPQDVQITSSVINYKA